jgi:uncharacterized membrane protein
MESLLDTISGLPVHPLVVHFAVVLLPLATTALILSIYIPKFRNRYAFAATLGVLIGTGAALVAKQSGEALAARLGNPQEHSNYGNILAWASVVFLALAIYWYRYIRQSNQVKLAGHATSLAGVLILGLTFLTGHTGAQAVWQGRLDKPAPTKSESPAANKAGITMTEISQHGDSKSCWSAIDGSVYDLTDWIGKHPGGAAVIKAICGKDGSAAFNGQHAGQKRPADFLAAYRIGDLGQ